MRLLCRALLWGCLCCLCCLCLCVLLRMRVRLVVPCWGVGAQPTTQLLLWYSWLAGNAGIVLNPHPNRAPVTPALLARLCHKTRLPLAAAAATSAVLNCHSCCSKICRRWEIELPDGKDHFRPITGLPISTYFSAYKFQWLLEHVPEVCACVRQD